MYLYEPEANGGQDRMSCASCVPTGDLPAGDAIAAQNGLFMADDGRTFFSTKAALVPFDTNGKMDVLRVHRGPSASDLIGYGEHRHLGRRPPIYPAMTVGLEGVSADGTDV